MMNHRHTWLPSVISISLFGLLLIAPQAHATIDNLKSYKQAYPGKDAKAYSCKVCHQGAIGKKGDLNAYGLALQKLREKPPIDTKKLTEEDYRAIEAEDADEDGASNLEELTGGTDPADPASVPEGIKSDEGEGAEEGEHSKHEHGGSSRQDPGLIGQVQAYLDRVAGTEAQAAESEGGSEEAAEHADYVGMETCAACHAKQYQEFKQSTHARIAIPEGSVAQGCETCHGPGSLHAAAGGGRGVGGIINPRKDPSTCFECHLDKKAEFRLPNHHPVLEGKMSCADCHTPHEAEVRPWSR